jgi:two-component system chemotaxis response regulator CheB
LKSDQQINKQEEGFAGTLKNIQLNDLIQMCCLSAASLGIRVTKNDKQGIIIIQDGQIIHAEVEAINGEKAFYKILGWESGVFETIDAGVVSQVTIKKGYQFLLMEAAHQADERASKKNSSIKTSRIVKKKLRVLVVDDSPMMSKILSSMINADDRIEVVGTAENGERALGMLDKLKPDLVTMDVNMPVMSGSTALKHIMIKSPCPVLIMSNVGDGAHKSIIDFLNLGAVDFMSKPVQNKHILIQQQKIVERVLQAAGAKISNFKRVRTPKVIQKDMSSKKEITFSDSLIIISAGAGGHSVLLDLISRIPGNLNSNIFIFQTIPPVLVKTVADYMNDRSQLKIIPVENSTQLRPGHCLFATHGGKLTFRSEGEITLIQVENSINDTIESDSDTFDEQLFQIARFFGDKVKIILLSGSEIGTLDGIKKIRKYGGKIIIQNRSKCMVSAPLQKVFEEKLFDMELDTEEIAKDISFIP